MVRGVQCRQRDIESRGAGFVSRRRAMKLALTAAVVIATLGVPGAASAADVLFSGKFKGGGGTVHFRLIAHGTKVQGWSWHDLPVQCREGHDFNSGSYTFDISVS